VTGAPKAGIAPGPAGARLREVEREAAAILAFDPDAGAFLDRLRQWWPDLWNGLERPYLEHPDRLASMRSLARVMAARWAARPTALRGLDRQRIARPDWFQDPSMVGYVFYVDRFAGTLRGVEDHLDYLEELGVRYVHLMPVLRPREGDNDGGYAVADYRAVAPELGTVDDLEHLAGSLRARGMSLCIDLVLNHTAAEHEWARRAADGEAVYAGYYRIYPDRTVPDAYERTLPEVFPDFAPGSFTRLSDGRWVWTTFNEWQWDLNWANPRVFVEILDILLEHANRGIDVFRLDAVAFMWKRLGTSSQNQPEVHDLLQALRACARIAAPSVIFKAEAIVGPEDLVPYLGVGSAHGRECDLAYHNSVMVQLWSAMATRDTRLMAHVLGNVPAKPSTTAWATYVRCHDDIGWAITERDAEAMGWSGPAHRAFLTAFYAGRHEGSFAVGDVFQENPATGDSRISGTCASLAGLERGLATGDEVAIDAAIRRILVAHALIASWDGIPLLYMGDEIGLRNDRSYLDDPRLANDNRWLHRPWMDWTAAARRDDPTTVEGRIHAGIRHIMRTRASLPHLHAATPLHVVGVGDRRVFAFVRAHERGPLLVLANLSHEAVTLDGRTLALAGLLDVRDALDPVSRYAQGDGVDLPPYVARWLVAQR